MTVLVVDDFCDGQREPFDVVRPWDLGLEPREIHRVRTLFDGAFPTGAFRGALIRYLLKTAGEPVLFLDPDTWVFASLEEVGNLAAEHSVVLVPHFLDAPDDHHGPTGDRALLLAGAFNSGLMAVGPNGMDFLDWWAPRLQRWMQLDPGAGYFGAQRWLDLVPAMFAHYVLRDPGCNVMDFNAHERLLSVREGQWYARERPLRLFHFGGAFDPHEPYVMGSGRADFLHENSALAEIHTRYAEALLSCGWDRRPPLATPLELEPGVTLDETMRSIYRDALLRSEESDDVVEPPNPYESGPAAFMDWLRSPSDLRRNACMVPRYLQARWHQDNLASRFPDLPGNDASGFVAWARGPGGVAAEIPASLTTSPVRATPFVPVTAKCVNVVTSDSGLPRFVGENIVHHLRSAGEDVIEVCYPRMDKARTGVSSQLAEAAVGDVTVLCVPVASVVAFDYDLGVLFRPGRHVIVAVVDSVWALQDFTNLRQIADEIWCWDGGTAGRIRGACDVHTENLPYPAGQSRPARRGHELVCWADLREPGHSDAALRRVSSFVSDEQPPHRELGLYVSGWEANPSVFETLYGLSRSCERLSVNRVASWQGAIEHAGSLMPLGVGIGPVEAEALRVGVDLIFPGEPRLCRGAADTALFGVAAGSRLASVRGSRG